MTMSSSKMSRPLLEAMAVVIATVIGCLLFWVSLQERQDADLATARQRGELRAMQLMEAAVDQSAVSLRQADMQLRQLRSLYLHDPRQFASNARDLFGHEPQGDQAVLTLLAASGKALYTSPHMPEGYSPTGGSPVSASAGESDRLDIRQVLSSTEAGQAWVELSRPLLDGPRTVGRIAIALRSDSLSQHLRSLRVVPDDMLAITLQDGRAVARSHQLAEALKSRVPASRPFLRAAPGERGTFRDVSTFDKRPLLFAWQRLSDWPVSVVAAINEETELATLRLALQSERRNTLISMGLVLCFALGVASLLLGIHGKSLALARSNALHRALFERSRVPSLLISPDDGQIVDSNAAAQTFYGYTAQALAGMNIGQINVLDLKDIRAEMALAKAQNRDCFFFAHRLANGEIRQVEVRSGPLEFDGRTLLYSLVHDITARREAERAVAVQVQRLETILKTASDGIHIVDADGTLVEANEAFLKMLKLDASVVGHLNVKDWDLETGAHSGQTRVRELIERRGQDIFEARHRRSDGVVVDVEVSACAIDIEGRSFVYAASRDISERLRMNDEMRIAATAFESQEGMIVADLDWRVLRVNRSFTDITGYRADEVVGSSTTQLQNVQDEPQISEQIREAVLTLGHWQGERTGRRKTGETYPQWLTVSAVRDSSGKPTHFVTTLTDITQRKAAENEIRNLAFFDPLTRLPNRRMLQDRLRHALAASGRHGSLGALLFLDLDNFKTLNDTLGHDHGDQLLQQVGSRLTHCVRAADTVARFGGDEFLIMLEDIGATRWEATDQAKRVGEKVLAALNLPYTLNGHVHHCTTSIGVAVFTGQDSSVDELLKRADLAMYQAKASGRNSLRFFDPEMQASVSARAVLEAELHLALARNEFTLHYQAQTNQSGKVSGSEALIRWQHPKFGLVLPSDFIALAEETGLILPIGRWVLNTACRQLKRWSEQPELAQMALSINVSARQFHHPDFAQEVLSALAESGADPHLLGLEITESLLLRDTEDTIAKMSALRQRGVRFSLDDFGTGYSSLSYLKRLPLDQLKIDRSFVRDLLTDSADLAITRTIVALAQGMGLEVLAEGVETSAQLDLLRRSECQMFQGYLFSQPLPLEAFETVARDRGVASDVLV